MHKHKLSSSHNAMLLARVKTLAIARPDVLHGYLRYKQVNQYLDYIERRYSHFVKVYTIGLSHEGRKVKAIEIDWRSPKNREHRTKESRISSRPTPEVPIRNMIFIEGGTHAREWITISVALHCVYQLTEKNIRHREILRKLRFCIVPLSNPDGYEYTWLKNPRWRKNRRPQDNPKIIGTDCNRNYDFHWECGSSNRSRNTYKGDRPFSEPETCALRNVLQKLSPHLVLFLSLHSYAQSIMYPWGYSRELPDRWQQLQKIASTGRNAIKALTGRSYRTGNIAGLSKGTISGSIVDYAYGILKIPFALVIELPSAELGFQPPLETIAPIGNESWFGIQEMCKAAYNMVPLDPQPIDERVHIEKKRKSRGLQSRDTFKKRSLASRVKRSK